MKTILRSFPKSAFLSALLLCVGALSAAAQGTAFTYQGRLADTGAPATGNYDLTFGLYAANSGGSPVGGVMTNLDLPISNGFFTVTLDFGNVFDGTQYWLELGVRTNGAVTGYTILTPRQALTPSPYALHAASASTSTGPVTVGQLPASVALLNGNASFTGTVTAGGFSGNGSGLTNLNGLTLTNVLAMRSIRSFGASGGTNDDSAAFQAAASYGQPVFIDPVTNYTIYTTIVLANNTCLIGYGTRIVFATSATGPMFSNSLPLTNIVIDGLYLDGLLYGATGGDGSGATTFWAPDPATRSGMWLCSGDRGSDVRNNVIIGFSDAGIRFSGPPGVTFPQPTSDQTAAHNNHIINCGIGVSWTNSAEYMESYGWQAELCYHAFDVESGNNWVHGGTVTRNYIGARVRGTGSNPAHGGFTDVTFNHNNIGVWCDNFNLGEQFTRCSFLGGGQISQNSILITNCASVKFQASILGPNPFVIDGGGYGPANGYNYIDHCEYQGVLPITPNGGLLAVDTPLSFRTLSSYTTNSFDTLYSGNNAFNGNSLTIQPPPIGVFSTGPVGTFARTPAIFTPIGTTNSYQITITATINTSSSTPGNLTVDLAYQTPTGGTEIATISAMDLTQTAGTVATYRAVLAMTSAQGVQISQSIGGAPAGDLFTVNFTATPVTPAFAGGITNAGTYMGTGRSYQGALLTVSNGVAGMLGAGIPSVNIAGAFGATGNTWTNTNACTVFICLDGLSSQVSIVNGTTQCTSGATFFYPLHPADTYRLFSATVPPTIATVTPVP